MIRKKGFFDNIFVWLIFFLLLLLVIMAIELDIIDSFSEEKDTYDCATSVGFGSVLTKLGAKNLPLRCRTGELILTENLDTEKGQNTAKFKIGSEMVDCWKKFQRGTLPLFEGTGKYCNICSIVQIDEKSKNKEIKEVKKYLATTNLPDEKITFLDYLMNFKSPKARQFVDESAFGEKQIDDNFPGIKDYAIIFLYVKGLNEVDEYRSKHLSLGTDSRAVGAGVHGGIRGVAVAAAGAFILGSNPVGWVVIAAGVVSAAAHWAHDFFVADHPQGWFSMVMLTEFDEKRLESVGCEVLK